MESGHEEPPFDKQTEKKNNYADASCCRKRKPIRRQRNTKHLTSHHLLSFVRLHVAIVLHRFLHAALGATCLIRGIERVRVVLQDDHLQRKAENVYVILQKALL